MTEANLHLIAQSAEDLPALSALLQDATLRLADIALDRRGRRLACLVNRYRWEAAQPSRVRAALRIEGVEQVQRLRWPTDRAAVLDLLSLTLEEGFLHLHFAGGPAIRVRAECVDVILEDMGAAWPTAHVPRHPA